VRALAEVVIPPTLYSLMRTALREDEALAGKMPAGTEVPGDGAGGAPALRHAISLLHVLAQVQRSAGMGERFAGAIPRTVQELAEAGCTTGR